MPAQTCDPSLSSLAKQSAATGGPVIAVLLYLAFGIYQDAQDLKGRMHASEEDRRELHRLMEKVKEDTERLERRTRHLPNGQKP